MRSQDEEINYNLLSLCFHFAFYIQDVDFCIIKRKKLAAYAALRFELTTSRYRCDIWMLFVFKNVQVNCSNKGNYVLDFTSVYFHGFISKRS